ncbi:DNA ligase [Arcobacter sp.]|uniref:DNA ligase n=1 Tax=Arcobacter sp. TaxID=1872629 RepID=UPI003D11E827
MKIFTSLFLFVFSLLAFDIQKPKVYDDQDITGWYMSEKLDGIRGYWDGKNLYTKNGNLINTPAYFTKDFPPFTLDGELWSKRDDFENIQAIVLDKEPSNKWSEITYNIFEVPNTKGDFLTRLDKAKVWFDKHPNKNVSIIKQIKCESEEHLLEFLDEIVDLNGEGVIIKDASKKYHTGRSPYILKVKKFLDMEGVVLGYNYKRDGSFKSLKVKLEDGTNFNLGGGFSDKQRQKPPKIGEIVTFKYYGFTKTGKPKFASFLRVRDIE